jgi:3-keto-5-aminohexanoate cleavage enzyme
MRKIIIALAPVGGWGIGDGNPVDPAALAREVSQCATAGASIVHLHARDRSGALTTDLSTFNEAVERIKSCADIILEASTGGVSSMTAIERALPAGNPHAELASLNMGSLNLGDRVYQNSLADIRLWIRMMSERRIVPSLEIFDTGNMEFALELIRQGVLTPGCHFSFVCNLDWGMRFHPVLVSFLRDRVPAGSHWGVNLIGSRDFSNHIEAARLGASVLRVGFEDSRCYNGKIAANNKDLVVALRAELEADGFSTATVDEARAVLLA